MAMVKGNSSGEAVGTGKIRGAGILKERIVRSKAEVAAFRNKLAQPLARNYRFRKVSGRKTTALALSKLIVFMTLIF